MKSNYVVRAEKFMKSFIPYLNSFDNIEDAVYEYNLAKHRHVEYYHGAARRCLCLSDYAVKWDFCETAVATFGGCRDEVINYDFACNYGYDYLFAEITPIKVEDYVFYVMPRVKRLATTFGEYEPNERLSFDEYEFLYDTMGLRDMHDENWGLVDGEVKIIDYANYYREDE